MASLEEIIREAKRKTAFSVLRALGVALLVLFLSVAFILWQQWNARQQAVETPGEQELSNEHKKAILERLSAPADSQEQTQEGKTRVLQGLSAPPGQTQLSEEEKKEILQSLSQ